MNIITQQELAPMAQQARSQGMRIALANGTFDVLHVGHVRYLRAAAQVADLLIVAINSDRSVRSLKGQGRPHIPEAERAEIIAGIKGVDYVLIFDRPTVTEVIKALRPDFQVKGTDYTEDTVPEGDLLRSLGGQVVIAGDPKDHDSSQLIAKIRSTQ